MDDLAATIGALVRLGNTITFRHSGTRTVATIVNDRAPQTTHEVPMPPDEWAASLYEGWRALYDHLPGLPHHRTPEGRT